MATSVAVWSDRMMVLVIGVAWTPIFRKRRATPSTRSSDQLQVSLATHGGGGLCGGLCDGPRRQAEAPDCLWKCPQTKDLNHGVFSGVDETINHDTRRMRARWINKPVCAAEMTMKRF